MLKSIPPVDKVFKLAGIELPEYIKISRIRASTLC